MINKKRVREEFKLAYADKEFGREMDRTGKFFKSDYVGKEMMISFLTGTICYAFLILLFLLAQMEALPQQVRSVDYAGLGISIAIGYIVFITVYILITALIYLARYRKMSRIRASYQAQLRKVSSMYEQHDLQE